MTNEMWGELKKNLRKSVGEHNYTHWIAPLELASVQNGVATLAAPSAYMGTYVQRNFGDLILGELSQVEDNVRRIEFNVIRPGLRPAPAVNTNQAMPAAAPTEYEPAAPVAAESTGVSAENLSMQERMLRPAPLDPSYTFDSFVVGKPNELAHAAARRVASGGEVEFNPLFLYGGVGLGKTHLMHAIAWEMKAQDPNLNVVYLSAEQFMYRFVQALREKKMMDFKALFRNVDVLMVDDVQFIAGKDSTQEEFFHTFNALVEHNKQIILSGDCAPNEIKQLPARLSSRLSSGLVVDLHPTDYELRLGILQSKVDAFQLKHPEIVVADGVMEFLAHRISTNVRVLEGALTRLFAFASLVGREITLELTQDCLSDVLRSSERKLTIEEIQRQVAEHYNIRLSDMIGPKRLRSFARPRQVAMYLCKKLTRRSLPEIGRRFGGRDHTTVMHGVKKIEELRQQDAQIADDLEMLRRALEE
ncbi:chromosomal replication initiator protein DnaA [Pseudooceanicola sp. CBS1P-1]|uniref:Chromosomal replication initiator protein DnaA n=1 Tax=Pseudooceanicola albus TaxID=2692189 RepID=A0A6L7G912_9RHOB|nr:MULTISPECIES: chromosomal replication initiator protein DnaA [Pseudooceanicola]MBT9385836.1 chromosomal replication initiator protein DnaA [Pseudooceanicola endophyticus]MXN20067.1 chromosomal replication initiator protein DnaA [Pseudooceanicola albus]